MAGKGGYRPGAGRKKKFRPPIEANKRIASEVLEMTARPIGHPTGKDGKPACICEQCTWFGLLHESGDYRLKFDVLKYLTDRRDGKPVQTVNHLHDKPIEMNVNLSIAEVVRKVRERKQEYERTRA